jgi:hypothetical protein
MTMSSSSPRPATLACKPLLGTRMLSKSQMAQSKHGCGCMVSHISGGMPTKRS